MELAPGLTLTRGACLSACLSQLAEQRTASSLGHQLFYLEALQLAEDGSVSCRVLR